MRTSKALLCFLSALGLALLVGAPAPSASFDHEGSLPEDSEILVKFRPTAAPAAAERVLRGLRLEERGRIERLGIRTVAVRDRARRAEVCARLNRDPRVAYAEPNTRLHLAGIPNDAYFSYQYGLFNTGQVIAPPRFPLLPGTPFADIKAPAAWDISTGRYPVVVGMVDTGTDLKHPDLIPNLLSAGRDFVNDDDDATDDHGHGTHVAGIIGAAANNGLGIAGICWTSRLLPVKVFNRNATGLKSWVVDGILWATDHGARVINMSLGGNDVEVGPALEEAMAYAYRRDVVLVAAAGNDGVRGVWYPAAYDAYALSAAATDQFDRHVTWASSGGKYGSNWGPEVDVAAPGLDVISTWGQTLFGRGHPGWIGYNYNFGTSMATAFVSGLAALIRAYRPNLRNDEVIAIIESTTDDVNAATLPGWDEELGTGRIDAFRALLAASAFTERRTGPGRPPRRTPYPWQDDSAARDPRRGLSDDQRTWRIK